MTEPDPIRLLDPMFRTGAMLAVFSDSSRLQGILEFESALARAESRLGIIPAGAAQAIQKQCVADRFDIAELAKAAAAAGNIAIPVVSALTRLVSADVPAAATFVHWGATSQDAVDTGLVLQIRRAAVTLDGDAEPLSKALRRLAEKHAATPIVGRTWLQHAVPITFGLKAAGWFSAVERSRARLEQATQAASFVQFGGAAGSLASLGDRGLDVAKALAKELDLDVPDLPWHAHRDRMVDVGSALGVLIGTLGKIARDISLLMQSELGEVAEPSAPGRGTSSSMPQKQNPVACAAVLAAATRAPGLVATLLFAMPQEHERGLGGWQAEWETLPELFLLASGAVSHTSAAIEGLQVNAERMLDDVNVTRGLVMAEAVTMALSPAVGRERAHQIVAAASRLAVAEGIHLRDVLAKDDEASRYLPVDALNHLFTLDVHVKAAERLVRHALEARPRTRAQA
ncbi:MAG TPA: 3-carboxy-cis,cis-muconate cycloisomerase [Vicinamibacterales bacterium]|jgi:3-carboxy-cis,cis-muconate cycloisomerase|nr:3-carboxy-cis,cis-muconate cycloisomerase [Vicinamibacterales bacterium]